MLNLRYDTVSLKISRLSELSLHVFVTASAWFLLSVFLPLSLSFDASSLFSLHPPSHHVKSYHPHSLNMFQLLSVSLFILHPILPLFLIPYLPFHPTSLSLFSPLSCWHLTSSPLILIFSLYLFVFYILSFLHSSPLLLSAYWILAGRRVFRENISWLFNLVSHSRFHLFSGLLSLGQELFSLFYFNISCLLIFSLVPETISNVLFLPSFLSLSVSKSIIALQLWVNYRLNRQIGSNREERESEIKKKRRKRKGQRGEPLSKE